MLQPLLSSLSMLFIATIICWEYLKYQKLKKNEEDKKLNPGISDRRLSIESETVDITMSCNSSSSVSSGSLGNATPATIEHDTTSAAVETASAEIPQDISIKKAEKSNIDSKNSGSFEKAEDVESNDELDDYPHDEIKTDIETPTTEDCKKITLTFSDYTDLQTRLLLLPRDDEDCKGAVISSYTSILENDSSSEDEIQKIANSNDEAGKNMSYRSIKVYPSLDESEGDRDTDFAEKSNLDEIEEKKSDSQHNDTTPSDQKMIKEEEKIMRQAPSYEGYVLLSIGGIQKPESIGDEEKEEETNLSLGDTDFSDILASCREAPCPIQLNFISAGDYKALVLPPSPSGPSTLLDEKENQKKANNNNVSKTANVFSNRFSKWSSRVRASTSMIAQETASRVQLVADDIATKAKKNATKSNLLLQTGEQTEQTEQQTVNSKDLETHISKSFDKDEFLNNDDESDTSDDSEEINDPICALFLQTKSGELVKISNNEHDAQFSSPTPSKRNNRSSKRDLQITNSSILTIRNSDESYLSTSSYACQWFISKPLTLKRSTSAAVSSSFLSPNKQKHNMSSNSLVEMNTSIHSSNSSTHTSSKTLSSSITPNWIKIPDAIHPTFQPSTTEVGYRLKCEVYVNYGEGDSTIISSQSRRTVFAHETQTVVSAESSLFNAARQNVGLMVNSGVTSSSSGAVFNNMRGYGKSEGRMFKVHVEMVPDNKTKNKILSKVSIFQFVGSTSEKMHDSDHPLCDCTAKASHNNPKLFNLVFSPEYQPDENSMLHLLCEQEDGENDDTAHQGRYLQLQAPNRISRESMLLSLGIANYKGKPSQLRNSTILFDNSMMDSENHQVETKSLHVAASIPKEVPCIRKADSGVLSTESMEDVVISASLPNPDDDCSSKENNDLLSNSASSTAGSNSHNYQKLEADLLRMAKKLSQKDKYISDLEKKLSLEKQEKKRMSKDKSRMEDESSKLGVEYKECYKNLRLAEKRIESHESAVTRVRKDFNVKILELENKISGLEQDLSDKEKVVKSLQNDKAVLAAAVEARDSKLEKVNEMRETISDLKVQVENGEVVKRELADMKEAYESVTEELARKDDLSKRNVDEIAKLNSENVKEQETRKGLLKELEDKAGALMEIENENQKLKTQRNKYKQKADSLSKEMSRICKGGTLKVQDVEKMLDDRESMKSEIFALKKGKQNALREIDEYRTECSNLKRAQQLLLQNSESTHGGANSSKEFSKSLERSAELEKIIEDMTEYVQAKEMQIETMRDVNKTLMEEVTTLRQLVEFSNNTSFNV